MLTNLNRIISYENNYPNDERGWMCENCETIYTEDRDETFCDECNDHDTWFENISDDHACTVFGQFIKENGLDDKFNEYCKEYFERLLENHE